VKWQPIESCPYGVVVLLYGDPYGSSDIEKSDVQIGVRTKEIEEGWELVDNNTQKRVRKETDIFNACLDPTHWAPLPPAPESE
jgi:hypothetical protein